MIEMDRIQPQYSFSNNNNHVKTNTGESRSSIHFVKEKEELKSVQKLTQFWNNRIISINNKLSALNANFKTNKTNSFLFKQKSATLGPNYRQTNYNLNQTENNLATTNEIKIEEKIETKVVLRQTEASSISSQTRSSCENFNKYKTADTVKRKHRSFDSTTVSPHTLSASIDNLSYRSTISFPLVSRNSTGDKIHWAKRDDKIKITKDQVKMVSKNGNKMIGSEGDSVISKKLKSNDKLLAGNSDSISSLSSSPSSSSLSRKTGRKLSFKTHPTQPRKILSGINGNPESKVAALTHRFNQLVNNDSKMLEEIKNKGVILYKTQNHIYKIRDNESNSNNNINNLNNKKKNIIIKKKSNSNSNDNLNSNKKTNVKATIELFEPKSTKPKVPDKSERVLMYRKELNNSKRNGQRKKNEINIDIVPNTNSQINDNQSLPIENPIDIVDNSSNKLNTTIENEEVPKTEVVDLNNISIDESSNNIQEINSDSSINSNEVILKIIEESDIIENLNSNQEVEQQQYLNEQQLNSIKIEKKDKPKSKSYGGRIYEKIRLKFSSNNNKNKQSHSIAELNNIAETINPDQKIVDALCSVNQKIENLSKSVNDINSITDRSSSIYTPNESFLYRSTSRNSFGSAYEMNNNEEIIEAVNVSLINKTQSMDETRFPSADYPSNENISNSDKDLDNIFQQADDLISKIINEYNVKSTNDDDDYEYISRPKDPNKEESNSNKLEEEPIQIQNIYETPKKKHVDNLIDTSESGIYQSISEVKQSIKNLKYGDTYSEHSYESYDNYECVEDKKPISEDGYEIMNNDPPEPPPPRKIVECLTKSESIPALPIPKRKLESSPKYEKIKYDKAPLRPAPKVPKKNEINSNNNLIEPIEQRNSKCNNDYDDDIYDAMRQIETRSFSSNCYESINSVTRSDFMPMNLLLAHSDSMSTLSSEHKTNSLYGTTIGQNCIPPSEGSSENSDDWIDVSDCEEAIKKNRFIVTRQRMKCFRNTDWSQKICDQKKQECDGDMYEDDSDHHYESLYSMGFPIDKKSSTNKGLIEEEEFEIISDFTEKKNNLSKTNDDERNVHHDDDFDSFDSDGGETDEELNKKHDSGVDISNAKLPDPPPSQVYAIMQKIKNFGSLSEISKSLVRIGKKKSSTSLSPVTLSNNSGKPNIEIITTSKSNDYSNPNEKHDYQNTKFNKKSSKTPKSLKKLSPTSNKSNDPYENTEFHTPRTPVVINNFTFETNEMSVDQSSLKNTSQNIENNVNLSQTDTANLSRKKSSKSFKSKFRKSFVLTETVNNSVNSNNSSSSANLNVGTPFNGKRSTFYIPDSVDVDSGIYSGSTDPIQQSTDESNTSLSVPQPAIATPNEYSTPKITAPPRRKNKLFQSPELNRRKTTIGIRPNNPPPPPPLNAKQKRLGNTSWYAECGVFKPETLIEDGNGLIKDGRKERNSLSSWYADAGLYQTSGASVASSSGSSGVSTGGEGGPGDDNSHSMFLNEPLYQIYNAAKLESISRDIMEQENSSDGGYEEVGRLKQTTQQHSEPNQQKKEETKKYQRPSALQLVEPKLGPSRTLWSQIPEVINSEILKNLSQKERYIQEAKFEIITSEASYLKSLNLLRSHFINHPAFRDTAILSSANRKCLFSKIIPVLECSDRLLCDLETCWQDNIMLTGLSKLIYKNAEKYFDVYIGYCEHQGRLDRTLKQIKEQRGIFSQKLEILETDRVCCGLSLHSFLMLPMQRITRLPLLIDAVISKLKITDEEFEDWKLTLSILYKIVQECNAAANRSEQIYELEEISRAIEFPLSISPIPIIPVGQGARQRILVRKGELTLWKNDDGKLTFGKKLTKLQKDITKMYAFLFTDLLVVTRKKADGKYQVTDYCQRSMLSLSSGDLIPQHLTKDLMLTGKFWMLMTLLENHDKKTVEMIVSCPTETERQRWLQATETPESENPDEKLYEQWDCPQVMAVHQYEAKQPDEISLELNEIVNVTRKMADGWYHGERLRDGIQGWFPGNYTREVASPHVRARNLKQRHRLLVFSANYLESQKKL